MKKSVFVALSAILLGTTSCSTMKTARYLTDYSELASYDHIAMAKFIPRNNNMDPLVLNIKHTLATYFEEVPHDSLDVLVSRGVRIISPRIGAASAREKKGETTVKISFDDYVSGRQIAEMTIVANGKETKDEHARVMKELNDILSKICH